MSYPQIDELRSQLLTAGYSTSYIARLCGELEDHYQSLADEAEKPKDGRSETEILGQRIGPAVAIYEAVVKTPELTPFVRRFPLVAFVWIPGFLLCVTSWLIINAAYLIGQSKSNFYGRQLLVDRFEFVTAGMMGLIGGCFVIVAWRRRMHWMLPFIASLIMSLFGFYQIDMAGCVASQGVFFESDWGISAANLLAPSTAMIAVMGLVWVNRSVRTKFSSKDPEVQPWVANGPPPVYFSCRRPWLVIATVTVLGAVFFLVVERTRDSTFIHPANGLVRSLNEPGSLEAIELQLLGEKSVREQLQIGEQYHQDLDRILKQFQAECRQLADEWRAAHPDQKWRMIEMSHFSVPLEKAKSQVNELITESQQRKLEQLAYAQMEWNIVFRSEVQQRIGISNRQLNKLKDALMEKTSNTNQVTTAWRQGEISEPKQISERKLAIQSQFEASISSTLSKRQLHRLVEVRGCEIGD